MTDPQRQRLSTVRESLRSLRALRNWRVGIYRDWRGSLLCTLDHRLGATSLSTDGRPDTEAVSWFRSEVRRSWLVSYLNSAPPVRFHKLPMNLLAGMGGYRWSLSAYRQVLVTLFVAGTISGRERAWMMKGALVDRVIRKRIMADSPSVRSRMPTPPGGATTRRPVGRRRAGRRSSSSGGLADAAASLKQILGRGWTVHASRQKDSSIDFTLSHRLSSGIVIPTGQVDPSIAAQRAAKEARRSKEWQAVSIAPPGSHERLLGQLRAGAAAWRWRPGLLYQVLERLSVAGVITGHEVLWVMRFGPPGNFRWTEPTDGLVIDEFDSWKTTVYPEWRAWELSQRKSGARKSD